MKDTETTVTLDVICYTCPICEETCFPDEAALQEHVASEHPWQWHFWYAPHGKPLLALVGGSTVFLVAAALLPKKPKGM